MFGILSNDSAEPSEFPAIAPDEPVVVVGDVHGCATLLHTILEHIGDTPTVFVGDYVNRGDDSAAVLNTLAARPELTCLLGNHEEMLLDFLDAPEDKGRRFLRNGGRETLKSFGVEIPDLDLGVTALYAARDAFQLAMGSELIDWLLARPVLWQSGNVAVVHAGADPNVLLEEQRRAHLIWGHPEFYNHPRKDGIWIVHGHRIVSSPRVQDGRISIDTGAYASGRLTRVLIEEGNILAQTVS